MGSPPVIPSAEVLDVGPKVRSATVGTMIELLAYIFPFHAGTTQTADFLGLRCRVLLSPPFLFLWGAGATFLYVEASFLCSRGCPMTFIVQV